MKSLHFFALLFVGILILGTSCERHPASETIPGYEKHAAQIKSAKEKEIVPASHAPTFFHGEENSH